MEKEQPRIEIDEHGRRIYEPDGAKLVDYLMCRAHVSIIRGPIGSGSSSASCNKIGLIATEQARGIDGVRRSRWAIVRNTYPELKNTTIKTWLDWFPKNLYGAMIWGEKPMRHVLRWGPLTEAGVPEIELEVLFLALDDEADIAKLRSLELTGVWFNEIEFILKQIFDEAESRTGRYPAVKDGGATWHGVLGDMNAPNEDHWIPQMKGEPPYPDELPDEKKIPWPEDWGYYVQAPALVEVFEPDGKTILRYEENPKAENKKWLKAGFYLEKIKGKTKQWIDSRLMNRITFFAEGEPVWKNFLRETHISPGRLEAKAGYKIIVALDFGRRPTALIGQEIANRIFAIDEFRMYGVGSTTFAPALKRHLERNYPGFTVEFTGDPKGRDKGQADETTAYDVFASLDMKVTPAPVKNNHLKTRLEAVEHVLNEMALGRARLQICPEKCPTLVAAMSGKYQMKKVGGDEAEPLKDKYSDAADCLQYLCLYLGEGRRMIGLEASRPPGRVNARAQTRSLRRA